MKLWKKKLSGASIRITLTSLTISRILVETWQHITQVLLNVIFTTQFGNWELLLESLSDALLFFCL